MRNYLLINFITLIILSLLSSSCYKKNEKWKHVEISPLDGSQVITIITKGNKRYVMDGKHNKIPKKGYLLLDISMVDQLGDAILVCWNDSSVYKWKIASTYATLINNQLDTSKFFYYQSLGVDGEPSSVGYTGNNCGSVSIREYKKPKSNLKIAYY